MTLLRLVSGVVVTPAVRDQSGGKGEPKVKRPRGRPPRLGEAV